MVERYEFTCHDSDPDAVNVNHGRYVRYADYAELEAENERQSSDIAEFMRRLGPRWFLEQGWFPESIEASDGL